MRRDKTVIVVRIVLALVLLYVIFGFIRKTVSAQSPDSRYWRQLYRAALSEIGKNKLPERIAEAEKAVRLRARELFQAAGDNGEETEALDDVM
jgi:hypothetical protein